MKLTTKERKKFRIRGNLKKVSKPGRFRLSVSRSSKNISAQIIDDNKNITILSASSKDKTIKTTAINRLYLTIKPNTGEMLSSPEPRASPPNNPAKTPPIADAVNQSPNI